MLYKSVWFARDGEVKANVEYYHFRNYPHTPKCIYDFAKCDETKVGWLMTIPVGFGIKNFFRCLLRKFIITDDDKEFNINLFERSLFNLFGR